MCPHVLLFSPYRLNRISFVSFLFDAYVSVAYWNRSVLSRLFLVNVNVFILVEEAASGRNFCEFGLLRAGLTSGIRISWLKILKTFFMRLQRLL